MFSESRKGTPVAYTRQNTQADYRRRLKERGITRLELHVRKSDIALMRAIVAALGDRKRSGSARALLREHFPPSSAKRGKTPASA
jgi:hypothetical protein